MSSLPTNTWSTLLRDCISSPLGILAMTCLLGYVAYISKRDEHPTYDDEDYAIGGVNKLPRPMRDLRLTKEKLKRYNANNSKGKYLVALMGTLYDVSSAAKDFGPGGPYAKLSGTNIMWYIRNAARFETRDLVTYMNEWKIMLEDHFYVAGVLESDDSDGSEVSTVYDSANEMDETEDEMDDVFMSNSSFTEWLENEADDDTLVDADITLKMST